MLHPDYSGAYIVVKRTINITVANNRDRRNKSSVLKKSAPFISCVSLFIIISFILIRKWCFSKSRLFRL